MPLGPPDPPTIDPVPTLPNGGVVAYWELFTSRDGNTGNDKSSTITLKFMAIGSNDPFSLETTLLSAAIPDTYESLNLKNVTHEQKGYGIYEFHALYVDKAAHPDAPIDTGDYLIEGETSGGTAHISHGYAVTSYPASGVTATDHKGAINVQNGQVNGIDVVIPQFNFRITKRVANASITNSYAAILARITGRTNDATFFSFAQGELLFKGATFRQGTNIDPEVTYEFAASPNVTGLVFGSITGVAKKGHEYLWVEYEETPDTTAGRMAMQPRTVWVHRIYEEDDFTDLGI